MSKRANTKAWHMDPKRVAQANAKRAATKQAKAAQSRPPVVQSEPSWMDSESYRAGYRAGFANGWRDGLEK